MKSVSSAMLISLSACLDGGALYAGDIRKLPVPVETIYPGQAIKPSQLTERKFRTTVNSLNGIATDAGSIAGREARRRLPAGKPIPLSVLQSPLAVRRGTLALASYTEQGLSISMPVTILQDGTLGDVIDARNTSTGAIVKVFVMAPGAVQVRGE